MSVIEGTPNLESITPPARRSPWRLAIAFALGAAGALSAFLLGIPGNGEFVATIWLAAFVGLLIAPGWPGFVALIAGVTVGAVLIDVSDGVFGLSSSSSPSCRHWLQMGPFARPSCCE